VKETELVLFVDDTNLLIIKRDESVLQHKVNVVMKKLEYWFQKNNFTINVEKQKQYHFTQNRIDFL
jgi:hypothetical protein